MTIQLGSIDVTANRSSCKWTPREQLGRLLWGFAWWIFRLSPRPFWWWRRALLRLFGANIGNKVHIYPTVRVMMPWNLHLEDYCAIGDHVILYALGPIHIGRRTTISQGSHICAGSHDWRDPEFPLIKPPISIGPDVWICADAFIGPGVTVGRRSIVGARAVVMKDVDAEVVVAGNPACRIKARI